MQTLLKKTSYAESSSSEIRCKCSFL